MPSVQAVCASVLKGEWVTVENINNNSYHSLDAYLPHLNHHFI